MRKRIGIVGGALNDLRGSVVTRLALVEAWVCAGRGGICIQASYRTQLGSDALFLRGHGPALN